MMTLSFLDIALISLAGGIGSMARAALGARIGRHLTAVGAIFAINAFGSFLIGLGLALFDTGALGFTLFGLGLLGGFTTVSTYALQVLELWREGHRRAALVAGLGSVIACPVLAGLGIWVGGAL